jgi:hypothetical protein
MLNEELYSFIDENENEDMRKQALRTGCKRFRIPRKGWAGGGWEP